jgi:glycolate oxidase
MGIFDRANEAAEAVSAIIAAGIIPVALEFFDGTTVRLYDSYQPTVYPKDADAILLIDVDSDLEDVIHDMNRVEAHLRRHARDVQRADDDATRADLWRGRLQTGQAAAAL